MKTHFQFYICVIGFLTFSCNASAGLIHRWDFEEASGTTVLDTAGSSNGTMINMAGTERSSDTPFGVGKSLSFDALSEHYVDFGASPILLESDSDFSVSFWYKGTQASQQSEWGAFGLLAWDSNGIAASLSLQQGRVLYSHYDGAWQTNIESSSFINNGEWNHVALVNYADETADLWINGVKEIDGEPSDISTNFRIQHLMRGHKDGYVAGALDDVRIYDHSLTSSEVASLSSVPEPHSLVAMLIALAMFPLYLKARSLAAK